MIVQKSLLAVSEPTTRSEKLLKNNVNSSFHTGGRLGFLNFDINEISPIISHHVKRVDEISSRKRVWINKTFRRTKTQHFAKTSFIDRCPISGNLVGDEAISLNLCFRRVHLREVNQRNRFCHCQSLCKWRIPQTVVHRLQWFIVSR